MNRAAVLANGVSAAPEPGTWAMLGLGGVVLVGASRLRRRKAMGASVASVAS